MRAHRAGRLWPVFVLFTLTACESSEITAPDQEPSSVPVPSVAPTGNSVVVFESEEGIPQAGIDLVTTLGGAVTSRYDAIGVLFAKGIGPAALETLRQSDLVADAGPDYELDWLPEDVIGDIVALEDDGQPQAHDPTRASQFRGWQWGPQRIAADQAWSAGFVGDPNVRVAILDTGVDAFYALGVDAVVQRLLGSADDVGAPGPDAYSNHGRINVLRAVR